MCLVRQVGNLQRVDKPLGRPETKSRSRMQSNDESGAARQRPCQPRTPNYPASSLQKAQKCKADDPHCVANHITTEP